MISSIIDVVLITALSVTSGCVLLMYRRLKRFDALQGDAAKAFAGASEALEQARFALHGLQTEGDAMAVTLANRLNEARMVINELDDTMSGHTSSRAAANPSPAPAPPPATRRAPPKTEPATADPLTIHASSHTGPNNQTDTTPWTPTAAKLKAVTKAKRDRDRAGSTGDVTTVTWSSLAKAADSHTAH